MNAKEKLPIIEYHILQSFPVTCLNRDDVGAPKTAIIGGYTRARVSSQCWKRSVRLALRNSGARMGIRTKKVETLFHDECIKLGASEEQAKRCSELMAKELVDDTLLFISSSEATRFAEFAKEKLFDAKQLEGKEIIKVGKKAVAPAIDALDIALFGRMVAKAADMNVEAAASFSHAISTHKISNDIDFFTALDDLQEEPGSAHMGSLEFNSATYYRYVSLDLEQLKDTLGKEGLKEAVRQFSEALFIAIPQARQTTQSGASPWEYANVTVRKGQRLQVPFETAVKRGEGGYLAASIAALKDYLTKKKKLCGSLYGELACFEWGEDENYSIDKLISEVQGSLGLS